MISLNSHDPEVSPDSLAKHSQLRPLYQTFHLTDQFQVRVIRLNGEFIINPSPTQMEEVRYRLNGWASTDSVAMVEGEMNEVSEGEMIEAIKEAHEAIKVQYAYKLN